MANVQIVRSTSGAVPGVYTLPDNAEFILRAVNADFADNGAAGDWLPAVEIVSDAGIVLARAVSQDVRVTAGDDAEVSWFPGVKPGGTASSEQPYIYLFRDRDEGNQTILSGNTTAMTARHIRTNDPSHAVYLPLQAYTNPSGFPEFPDNETPWGGDANNVAVVRVRQAGLYVMHASIREEGWQPLRFTSRVDDFTTDAPPIDQRTQLWVDNVLDFWPGTPGSAFIAGTEDTSLGLNSKVCYISVPMQNLSGADRTLRGEFHWTIHRVAQTGVTENIQS